MGPESLVAGSADQLLLTMLGHVVLEVDWPGESLLATAAGMPCLFVDLLVFGQRVERP